MEDVKLDTKATYEIISNVKPHQLQAVNVIEAGPPQSDLVDNQTQATVRFNSKNAKTSNAKADIANISIKHEINNNIFKFLILIQNINIKNINIKY